MIVVDGSRGEGGGQILRTAVALSAVTHDPVRVTNIRAGRPNPGLAPSHVTSVEAAANLCDARVDGLHPGSKEIVFTPGELLGGEFRFDIGTAGSISLVIQCCLLPAILSKSPTRITLTGGTDVRWSPPMDYLLRVHLPILERFGAKASAEIASRGFFPEGGGEVHLEVSPSGQLTGGSLRTAGEVQHIEGVAFTQNLPEHVADRMRHSAMKKLVQFADVKVASDLRTGRSTGAGIMLVAKCEKSVLGASALGEKGLRAEALGESSAEDLIETVRSAAAVDEHMLDQILPYMALARGSSQVVAEEITGHARANMLVIEQFLERRFSVDKFGDLVEVSVD
jgi:RNA 3'-terminal phosphate cyclase (ATP)